MSSEGKRWGAEIFATERERELASEVERLRERPDAAFFERVRNERDEAEAEVERLERQCVEYGDRHAQTVASLSAEVERLRAALERIRDGSLHRVECVTCPCDRYEALTALGAVHRPEERRST